MKKSLCMLAALSIACPCYLAFAADDAAQTDGTQSEYSVEKPQDVIETHELEQPKDTERLEIFGIFGNRYDWTENSGMTDESSVIILKTTFKFNDYFTGVTQSEAHQWWGDDVDTSNFPSALADSYDENWRDWFYQGYVEGKYSMFGAKMGRFTYFPAYGITHGDYQVVSGGQISFHLDDKFSLTATTGQNSHHMGPFQEQDSTDYNEADFALNVIPMLNIKAAWMSSDDDSEKINYTESGFDVKLPMNMAFEAAYMKSDADSGDDTGYYAKLQYGQAIPFVGSTYDIFLTYHDLEADSIMGNDIPLDSDTKGLRLGFHYVPINNVQIWCFYDNAKVISTDEDEDFFRIQVDFFFDWKAL